MAFDAQWVVNGHFILHSDDEKPTKLVKKRVKFYDAPIQQYCGAFRVSTSFTHQNSGCSSSALDPEGISVKSFDLSEVFQFNSWLDLLIVWQG